MQDAPLCYGGDSQINDAAGDDVPLSQAGLRVRVLPLARYVGLANTAALGGDELRGRHEDRGCRDRRWLLPLGCHGSRSATPGASSFPFCPAHSSTVVHGGSQWCEHQGCRASNLRARCHRCAEGCNSVNAKVDRKYQGTQAARSKMGAQNACLSNCAKPWGLSCVPRAAAPLHFAAELCLGSPSLQAPTFAVLGRSGLRRVAQHQLGRPACRRSRAPSALGSSSRTGCSLAASL